MGSSFTAPNEMRNSTRWYKAEIEGAAPECDKSSLNKSMAAWPSSLTLIDVTRSNGRSFRHTQGERSHVLGFLVPLLDLHRDHGAAALVHGAMVCPATRTSHPCN